MIQFYTTDILFSNMENEPGKEKNKNLGMLIGGVALKGFGVLVKLLLPESIYNKFTKKS